MKRIEGIMKAVPEKRYKNFITHVADYEEVWLLDLGDGYLVYEIEGEEYLAVWQEKELAEMIANENEKPIKIEVHDFCELCQENMESGLKFMVCPNGNNAYLAELDEVYNDIRDELELLE